MASYNVTAPDGQSYKVTVPEGVKPTPDQLFEFVEQNYRTPKGANLDPIIDAAAAKHKLDPALIRSVVKAESAYNPRAVSPKGAQGAMQLMPETARMLGVKNPFNARQNIEGGTRHFAYLLDKYNGNVELAVAAYNAGEGNVDKHGGVPPFPETQDYVKKVLGGPNTPARVEAPTPPLPPQPAKGRTLSSLITGEAAPQEDLSKIAVQAAKHGVLSTVTTPVELAAWASDKISDAARFAFRPANEAVRSLLEKAGVPVTSEPAPQLRDYTNPILEKATTTLAGPKPEPKTGKGQTVALASGLAGAIAPFGAAGLARAGGKKLFGVAEDVAEGAYKGLGSLAKEARAPKGGVKTPMSSRPYEETVPGLGVTATDEAKIVARSNDPAAIDSVAVPASNGTIPKQGTILDPKGASTPGNPPYKTYWGRLVGKLFPHLPVLEKQPKSPVVTLSQQRAVSLGEDMGRMFDQPWSKFLYEGGSAEDFTRQFAQWEANGFVNAPPNIRAAKAWLEALRPREQAAAKYLGERSLDDVASYWPHIADNAMAKAFQVGRHETGIHSELRSTLGMFEETRRWPTMLEGMANGQTYIDPRQAYLIRVWTSLKMIHTAEYLQALEKAGTLTRKPKTGGFRMEGIPGGERWASTPQEAHFIQQQLKELGGNNPFSRALHWGNAVLRNPNLINPLPHLVRNMSFKYWWSGGSLRKLVPDFKEFLTNGNPQMIALFKKYMPFEYTGRTGSDLMHEAMYRMNHPVLKKITNDWNLLWQMQRWSSKTIFTRWDPAIKYARFKQYVQSGMDPQQAANNVNVDLIDYGMRSELVDWWKSLPLNFFVPWRTGTAQSMVKQMMHHPIRTALFIGGIDYLREVTYRNTGWWLHLPIDYIEAPIAQIITEGAKNPEKFARAVANITATTAMFGIGGQATAYQWQNIVDGLRGTIEWPKIKNMFWGLALLAEPYGALTEFDKGNYAKVLEIFASSLVLGAHSSLESQPKRGFRFAPEWLPGLERTERVKQAEAIQGARELRRDLRREMPERPKLKDILK